MTARTLSAAMLGGGLLALAACDSGVGVESGRPVLTNRPATATDHNDRWSYGPTWADSDGDSVVFGVVTQPAWMEFDPVVPELSGVPGWDNIGAHRLTVSLDDGSGPVTLGFDITVTKGEIHWDEGWPPTPSEAEYILPFREGASYGVSQSYCNPTNSHDLLHAYDIDTEMGDTLIASRAGLVIFVRTHLADDNATAGEENWIWIEHDDGSVMNYVHIAQGGALVGTGQRVERGAPIALSGNSGLTHKPHVHTALYRSASDFSRQASIPIAYRNAIGTLDANGDLRFGQSYLAGPPGS